MKKFHTGTMKKLVIAKTSNAKAWSKISKIANLSWVMDVKKTVFLSKIKCGNGAIRKIKFSDGSEVEEHIVGWKKGEYFSYIAVSGLPLRAYHATISLKPKDKNTTQIIWQSYFNSQKMTRKEFSEFVSFIGNFYTNSLKNLKSQLEK